MDQPYPLKMDSEAAEAKASSVSMALHPDQVHGETIFLLGSFRHTSHLNRLVVQIGRAAGS
jgi:hypothetical protein